MYIYYDKYIGNNLNQDNTVEPVYNGRHPWDQQI